MNRPGRNPKGKFSNSGSGGGRFTQILGAFTGDPDVTQNSNAQPEDFQMYSNEYNQAMGGTPFYKDASGNLTRNPVSSNAGFWSRLMGKPDYSGQINAQYAQERALLPTALEREQGLADITRNSNVLQAQQLTPILTQRDLLTHYANQGVDPNDVPKLTPTAAQKVNAGNLSATAQFNADSAVAQNRLAQENANSPFVVPLANLQNNLRLSQLGEQYDYQTNPDLAAGRLDMQFANQAEALNKAQKSGTIEVGPGQSMIVPPASYGNTKLPGMMATGLQQSHTEEPIVINGKPTGFFKQVQRTTQPNFQVLAPIATGGEDTSPLKGFQFPDGSIAPLKNQSLAPTAAGQVTPPVSDYPKQQPVQQAPPAKDNFGNPEMTITPPMAAILEDPRLNAEQKVAMITPLLKSSYPQSYSQKRTYQNPDSFSPYFNWLLKALPGYK